MFYAGFYLGLALAVLVAMAAGGRPAGMFAGGLFAVFVAVAVGLGFHSLGQAMGMGG